MSKPYRPLTQSMLQALGDLEGFAVPTWTGPGLPGPATAEAVQEIVDVLDRLLARGQSLVQPQDGLSMVYTLAGIIARAERFLIGPETHVERAAALRALATTVQGVIDKTGLVHALEAHILPDLADLAARIARWLPHRDVPPAPSRPTDAAVDYSALALEHVHQFSMGWTTLDDVFRTAYRHLDGYVSAVTDPACATAQFWPLLSRTALPYNLLVLRRLDAGSAEPFQTNFGAGWTAQCDALLQAGRLYGIDMTMFTGLAPETLSNGTTRFTPNTMALLEMDEAKGLNPIATYVADPVDPATAQTYTPSSGAWIYSLLAVKTSLTVHGIWLGHVYPLHLVTAALQMSLLNTMPQDHILYQALAPHCRFTIPFDFLLLAGWSQLAPPTSIGDAGKFLVLASRYAVTHDFFSTDPKTMLASLGLDEAAFTGPDGPAWNLYPNVRRMVRLWDMIAAYVRGVVESGYPTDGHVAHDRDLAAWISEAAAPDGGNLANMPRVQTRAMLERVMTSFLYRILFHGMGRLRSVSNPEPSFAPNFPPCLQSRRVPRADQTVTTDILLQEFLPRTGTIGELVTFYDLFAFSAPAVPLVPTRGPKDELFFDDRYPGANESLVTLREGIETLVADMQKDWVQVGQWPMNIEF